MTARLNLAVVGYGQIAELHTLIAASERHRLAWLIGRRSGPASTFAQRHGFGRFSLRLLDALEDPVVDAVILCTPNEQHAAQAQACLEAGKHVLVEIPLAMSYAKGRELAEQSARLGITLMVCHTHRYQGAMRHVRKQVEHGELALEHVIARYLLLRRENIGSSGYARSWADNLLWHHGQHAVDMTMWLLGIDRTGQAKVTSAVALPDVRTSASLDLSIILRSQDDQIGTVAMSYNSDLPQLYDFLLISRGRTLAIENGVLRDRNKVVYNPDVDAAAIDSRVLQDREFFAAVQEQRPAAISAESVLPAMEVLQRVQDDFDAGSAAGVRHRTARDRRGAPPGH